MIGRGEWNEDCAKVVAAHGRADVVSGSVGGRLEEDIEWGLDGRVSDGETLPLLDTTK